MPFCTLNLSTWVEMQTSVTRLEFSVVDLKSRWQRARLASLATPDDEGAAIVEMATRPLADQEIVLRRAYDNSRKLGLSLARISGEMWGFERIAETLEALSLPCVAGKWFSINGQSCLRRQPCAGATAFTCSYWREAVDGFVTGVGDTARFSRHQSAAAQDTECVDFLYDSERADMRWKEVPPLMAEQFLPAQERLDKTGVELLLNGYANGTLFYSVKMREGSPCGSGLKLLLHSFFAIAREHFPHVILQDTAPRAVMSE